jgi:hypothetical protein
MVPTRTAGSHRAEHPRERRRLTPGSGWPPASGDSPPKGAAAPAADRDHRDGCPAPPRAENIFLRYGPAEASPRRPCRPRRLSAIALLGHCAATLRERAKLGPPRLRTRRAMASALSRRSRCAGAGPWRPRAPVAAALGAAVAIALMVVLISGGDVDRASTSEERSASALDASTTSTRAREAEAGPTIAGTGDPVDPTRLRVARRE